MLSYVVDLEDSFSDIPTTLLRSKEELDRRSGHQDASLTTNDFVIQKLIEVIWNSRTGDRGEASRRIKKPVNAGGRKRMAAIVEPVEALASEPIYRSDELAGEPAQGTPQPSKIVATSAKRQFQTPTNLKEYDIPQSVMYSNKETVVQMPVKVRSSKINMSNVADSYAECYPGTAAEEDVNIDSDDEPDYDKMDLGNRKGPVGRWDFETQEEYSDYMSTREAMPKAAFQYGVKMADGRRTRTRQALMDDKRKLDRQWQQIARIIEKRKENATGNTTPAE